MVTNVQICENQPPSLNAVGAFKMIQETSWSFDLLYIAGGRFVWNVGVETVFNMRWHEHYSGTFFVVYSVTCLVKSIIWAKHLLAIFSSPTNLSCALPVNSKAVPTMAHLRIFPSKFGHSKWDLLSLNTQMMLLVIQCTLDWQTKMVSFETPQLLPAPFALSLWQVALPVVPRDCSKWLTLKTAVKRMWPCTLLTKGLGPPNGRFPLSHFFGYTREN